LTNAASENRQTIDAFAGELTDAHARAQSTGSALATRPRVSFRLRSA